MLINCLGEKFGAVIKRDDRGRGFAAIVTWRIGHGGPAQVYGEDMDALQFRLRGLDPSVQFDGRNNGRDIGDDILKCEACGASFTFTAGEAQFFLEHDLRVPKTCKPCRKSRRENGIGNARTERRVSGAGHLTR
jgi:hypothetical protein